MSRKKFNLIVASALSLMLISCAHGISTVRTTGELITEQNLNEKIDSLLHDDFFKSCQIGVDVYDLTSDKYLYRKNQKLLFHPASNQKLLTSLTALKFLPKDYNFTTSVYYDGLLQDSVINGNIIFVGGYDSEFSTKDLDSIAAAIKKMGISKITGNIYADVSAMDSLYWGNGWMWDDNPEIYSPYLSPLSINRNGVKFIFQPGELGYPVRVIICPESKYYNFVNTSKTVNSDSSTFQITRDWMNNKNEFIAYGNLSVNSPKDSLELNVISPEKYFLTLAKEIFERNGIKTGEIKDILLLPMRAIKLVEFKRPLDSLLVYMNKQSDNLSAELLLRNIGMYAYGKPGTAKKGIKLIDSLITLASFNPKDYKIVDGSGLSEYNLISAELIAGLLKHTYKNDFDNFKRLINSLPISGKDGTLKNRLKDSLTYQKIRAKTGTLSGVSNLSGYLQTQSQHLICFSILVQHFVGSSAEARSYQDKICKILTQLQ
ncbi:D-alanyl-D-alanine carboxypeptidase/D-alanyl-D-alanine-endopeptidase [Melioribacteraceae bacterium 4301-Me]|uniref:D-alanyl-D-alanine carboxypeptidase/D-alanyl-D-alanine endopeptidase n=1 Tax=Pyranulibacter aquaticus TaxID=3163344 RepID=UPI00359687FF